MSTKPTVIGQDNKKESLIRREWQDFSKTTAFAEMMKYAELNRDNFLRFAEEMSMPGADGKGHVSLDDKMSINLLQNRRGIGILLTYIRLYTK